MARDIRGIGFKTADAIAMKLGIEKTAMIRVRVGISYALTEAMHEGHCGLPTAELTPLEHFSIRLGVAGVCEISFAFVFGNPFEKRGDCSPKFLNSSRLHFA